MQINGPRSLQTKLWRLHDELSNDARRVEAQEEDPAIVRALEDIAARCRKMAEYLGK
jgi:hypothetical protein